MIKLIVDEIAQERKEEKGIYGRIRRESEENLRAVAEVEYLMLGQAPA